MATKMTKTWKAGDVAWAKGLDGHCRPVAVRVDVVRVLEAGKEVSGYDCVTRSGGVNCYSRLADLSESAAEVLAKITAG